MYVLEVGTKQKHPVKVEAIDVADYKLISKSRYFFDWKTEKENHVYKLTLGDDILGLMSCIHYPEQEWIEIKLLAVAIENRGRGKKYDRIAGTLIAYACREAMKLHGIAALVSLVPKDVLAPHYMKAYGMSGMGLQLALMGQPLLDILKKYEI